MCMHTNTNTCTHKGGRGLRKEALGVGETRRKERKIKGIHFAVAVSASQTGALSTDRGLPHGMREGQDSTADRALTPCWHCAPLGGDSMEYSVSEKGARQYS